MTIWPLVALATTLGCDDGAATIAREAADRQAEQNLAMAALQQEVAVGARQLVEEEGQARRQTLEVHRDLVAGQNRLADGWNDVESQRQQIARSRRTESFWAAILPAGGGVVAAVLALAFAWLALFGLHRTDDSSEVACQLLVQQLADPEQAFELADVRESPRQQLPPSVQLAGLLTDDGATDPTADPSPEENP